MKIINVDINDEIIFKNVLDVDTGVITGISAYVKLPTGNYNNIILNFSFANKSLCDNFNIFASFKINNDTPIIQELEPMTIGNVTYERACNIPNEVFQDKCEVTLGVYGYRLNEDETLDKRFSLVPVRNFVIEGSYDPESAEGIVPTPTVFEIYFDRIKKDTEELEAFMDKSAEDIDTMLTQCETDYNTFKAEKDAEVQDFLNNAEGEFMGTVNQLEAEFAETQTLVNELETTVTEAETKVNNMQTTVDEMGTELDNVGSILNYELMTLKSEEDLSEELTASAVCGQLDSIYTSSASGHCIGKTDPRAWEFTVTSGKTLSLSTDSGSGKVFAYASYGSSNYSSLHYINYNLKRTTYGSSYYMGVRSMEATTFEMKWDLYQKCTPTFNYRLATDCGSNAKVPTLQLMGSNNGNSWSNCGTLTSGNALTLTPSTAYRYYKLKVTLNGVNSGTWASGYSQVKIYYAYFSNVPDTTYEFRNNFIVNNDFTIQEVKNVLVPSCTSYAVENTVNGIVVDKVLKEDEVLTLRYSEEMLSVVDKPPLIASRSISDSEVEVEISLNGAKAVIVDDAGASTGTHSFGARLVQPGQTLTSFIGSSTSYYIKASLSSDGKTLTVSNTSESSFVLSYIAFY